MAVIHGIDAISSSLSRLTVLEAMFTDVRYSRWLSHRLKNLELNILLMTVLWWLRRHRWISPSWISLNLGPIGLLGIDFAGELQVEWKTPSSTLDCRDHWWNTEEVEDDEEEDECKLEKALGAVRRSQPPDVPALDTVLETLDKPDEWLVVTGDWVSLAVDGRTLSADDRHEAIAWLKSLGSRLTGYVSFNRDMNCRTQLEPKFSGLYNSPAIKLSMQPMFANAVRVSGVAMMMVCDGGRGCGRPLMVQIAHKKTLKSTLLW